MSWADLSYILPVTAIGYVLSALAGKLFLAEHISLAAMERNTADRCRNRAGRPHTGGDALMRWLLVAAIVASTAAGDLLQSFEMKRHKQSSLAQTVGFLQSAAVDAEHRVHGDVVLLLYGSPANRGFQLRCSRNCGHGCG